VLQALRRTSGFALAGPAGHLLFTSVTREEKYKAKPFIDTVVYRAGDMVGSWVFAGLGTLGLGLTARAWMALPLTAAWLAMVGLIMRSRRR
jgi:AAA family ATP:ADP antiporter